MNNIKVSVIMPSLNVGEFISECIESVINQTIADIEIICVDAGSTDGTLEILREYEQKYSKIKVLLSDKKSYGYQVNLGFSQANGEYLAIVETDDYIRKDMFEKLYETAKENDLDYVKANYAKFKDEGKSRTFQHMNIVENDFYYDRVLWAGDEPSVFNGSIYPWAGIYKRSLIVDNNVKLNETPGASYQDNGFCFQIYAYGKRGYFVRDEFYFLRRDEQDASYYAPHKMNEIFLEFDFIYNFLVKSGYYKVFAPRFWKLKYQTFCWRANMLADEHKLEFMQHFADEFRTAYRDGILNTEYFNENEKTSLFNVMASPDLVCWKKYYNESSVWQKNAVTAEKIDLPQNRLSIKGKKILMVTNELSYSGAQLSTFAQCDILRQAGAEVNVWSLKEGELYEKYIEQGVDVKIVQPHEFERSFIQDRIKQFDLVIICTVLSIAAADACRKLVPTIFYIRSDGRLIVHFLQKTITFQKDYERFYSLKNAQYVVAVSDYCGDWVKENINPNVYVINNFLEDKYEEYANVSIAGRKNGRKIGRRIKFLALGSIEHRKGFDVYLDAFEALSHEERNRCELHFAGRLLKGSEDYYDTIIRRAARIENCFYHGEITDRDEIYRLIMKCDVIVVPSRNESSSRVAIEGAMMAKPLVVTADIGAKYLVNEQTGWIVETGSPGSLEAAFRFALSARKKLAKMGNCARQMYLETSTPKIYSDRFIDYVERVLQDSIDKDYRRQNAKKLYSFDVFDTLFTRTTITPPGIFAIVQRSLNNGSEWSDIPNHVKSNFYELRINAERLARVMCRGTDFDKYDEENLPHEDVTFEDIYQVLTFSNLLTDTQAKRIMELEIQTEISSLVGIPRNIEFVKRLIADGNRVIAISDMYHSGTVIRRMLLSVDPVFENVVVYSSSDLMLTKGSGNIYRKIREIESINFEDWHHTGDNKRSDYEIPKTLGMTAELYPITWRNDIENYMIDGNYSDAYTQMFIADARNAKAIYDLRGKAAVGADLGTFFLLPYVDFILNNCLSRGIKRLYFIARDGYILQKIADILIEKRGLDISTKYVYGSRKAWRVFSEKPAAIDIMTLVSCSNFNHIKSLGQLADVFMITADELLEFLPGYGAEDAINTAELYAITKRLDGNASFKAFLSEKSRVKRELMLGYFRQEIDLNNSDYAFVELNGSGVTADIMSSVVYNAQDKAKPVKIFFYWATNTNLANKAHEFIAFFPSKIAMGTIIECLCRAPHPQVSGYRDEAGEIVPVFAENNEGETLMAEGYDEYIVGVLAAAKVYRATNNLNVISMVERAFNYITKCPDSEILTFLGDIPFEVTGRSNNISRFAPTLSDEDIFNVYFRRHVKKEPVEVYFPVSYFDYCLLRCTAKNKLLIEKYKQLLSEYSKNGKLYSLTEDDLWKIRRDAESHIYKDAPMTTAKLVVPVKTAAPAEPIISTFERDIYSSYSWRIGHRLVLMANRIRNKKVIRKLLNLKPVKKIALKILHSFLDE